MKTELIPHEDMQYLKNKYHKESEPFDSFNRFAYHGYEYDAATGLDDEQMQEELERIFEQTRTLPHCLAKAEGFAFVLEHMRVDVNAHDWFVGLYNWGRPLEKTFIARWREEAFAEQTPLHQLRDDVAIAGVLFSGPDYDHVIPNWDVLLDVGFPGLLARIQKYRGLHGGEDPEKDAFYGAMEREYQAVLRLIGRLRKRAQQETHKKSWTIADCLAQLEKGAPRTLYEALQCMYLFFMTCECIDNFQTRSLGNGIDQSLYRFYKADIESGRYTRRQLQSFLSYFFMQFSAMGSYWGQPMYIGGTDLQGNTLVNPLSYDIVEIYGELGIYNPKVQVKLNTNTPKDFTGKILDLIRNGINSFVFCCEPAFVKAIQSYGASYEEACDFEISGCYETRVKYKETGAIVGWVNVLKPVLLVLDNGFDKQTGKQIGVQTGDISAFGSFADFYDAYCTQLKYILDLQMEISNVLYDPVLAQINPSLMYSGTNLASLEKGVDGYAYANQYNNSVIEHCGLGSAVDALMAVKEFVYERKELSLEELREVLHDNWAGKELLRSKIRNSPCKFGNHHPVADQYAADIAALFAGYITGKPNNRGGVFLAELHSARQYVEHGRLTAATPDGRRDGEEISKNASPAMGMDRCGTTALMLSALALQPALHAEGFCLDVMLHPTTVSGEDGLVVMQSLLDVYLRGGGMAIHFNVFQAETLRDAKKHPENYQNLQVRVCGWNVLWNNLSRQEQEAYILRAESILV